jgi:hypothetical protein
VSDRGQYYAFGTALLVVAGIAVAVNAALFSGAFAAHHPYSFWTSPAMWVAYALGLVAVVLFGAGVRGLPFPPWRTAQFPNLEIEVQRSRIERDSHDLWLAFRLRITNREPDRAASLRFTWRGRVRPGHLLDIHPRGEEWGETPFVRATGDPPIGFPTDWLPEPVNVAPLSSAGGLYVAKVSQIWLVGLVDPPDNSLLVEDHTSGCAVAVPAQTGVFTRSNWVTLSRNPRGVWVVYPASGGAVDDANPGAGSESS